MLKQGYTGQLLTPSADQPSLSFLLPPCAPQRLHLSSQPRLLIQAVCTPSPSRIIKRPEQAFLPLNNESCTFSIEDEDLIKQQQSNAYYEFHDIVSDCLLNKDFGTYPKAYSVVCGHGLESYNYLGHQLISVLSENGSVHEATRLFLKLHDPDVFAWCAFISVYADNGQENIAISLYYQMCQSTVEPDGHIFRLVLKACANASALLEGQVIHCHIVSCGAECNIFVCGALLDMYVKCQSLVNALGVFEDMPEQDAVTWSTLLAGYASDGLGQEALDLFSQMQEEGIQATPVTFISILKACSSISSIEEGQLSHASIVQNGYETNVYLANNLIDMYSKCGSFEDAGIAFDKLHFKDVGSWNTMIGSCAQHGMVDEATYLFQKMQDEGMKPVNITFVNLLKAIADREALDKGKIVHSIVIVYGIESDVFVGSMLVHFYAQFGCLQEARAIFEKLPNPNVVTWGTIIDGYARYGLSMEALLLFKKMQEAGVQVDQGIFIGVLKASSSVSSLPQGQTFHELAVELDFEHDELVGNALTTMYATCGSIDDALYVFNRRLHRTTMAWNALISGLALNQPDYAYGQKAFLAFQQMLEEAVQPDKVTYISMLKICSSLSSLNQGTMIHSCTVDSGLNLNVKVANALIDMYFKCGSLDDACRVASCLPLWDTITFNTFIEGFGQTGHARQALLVFNQMQRVKMEMDECTFISLLSACSHDGLVQEGCGFFKLLRVHGIVPKIDHYDLMVDLVGRAGYLSEAEDLLETMPFSSDFIGWMALLTHCKRHVNVEIGCRCFRVAVKMDPENAASYVLMSNLYAKAGMFKNAEKLEDIRRGTMGAIKKPGKALIEIGNKLHEFTVGCRARNPSGEAVYAKLEELRPRLKQGGYIPQVSMVLGSSSNEEKESMLWEHCEKLAIAFGLINSAEGSTIRVSKNLRVCSDCHNLTKVLSKVEKREIYIMDTYRVHHFVGGECCCKDYD